MNRLYWLTMGIIVGALGYRYFREQGGQIAGLEPLGEHGRRLTERSREFAESGKQFAQSGRELAEESRQFAQIAVETAQSRGREVVDTMKAQASKLQGTNLAEDQREDVSTGSGS